MSDSARDYIAAMFGMGGRVAAVTGAASGLGAAWARGFARAGATTLLLDRDLTGAEANAASIRAEGGNAEAIEVDVTDAESVAAAVRGVAGRHARIDVLLNSAGAGHRAPVEDFPADAFDRVIALNLRGTFLMCQEVGRHMLAQGAGCIINVASIGGFIAYPNASAYLASKGGVVQLTRAMALEWIGRGVRVNAIAPTLCATPLIKNLDRAGSSTTDWIRSHMPRPVLVEPEELVSAALFLASPASGRVTGHILAVDDGYLIA